MEIMIAEFSARMSRIVSDQECSQPGAAGFLAAIADARKAVDGIAPEYQFTFRLNPNPPAMGSDPAVVFPLLLAETEGWLAFIVHSVAYRIGHFSDDIVTGLDGARPYRAVGGARSLLELAAFIHHHTQILVRESTQLFSESTEDFLAAVKGVVTVLKAASHSAQVTRFNWKALVRGDLDEFFTAWDKVDESLKAKQILSLIDKLPGEEKRAARFYYEMLCDYVHPNVGAHTLVVNTTEPLPGDRMRWDLRREPGSDEALYVLIQAVAIPVRHSIRILLHDLEQLQKMRTGFAEWKRRCDTLAKGET